MKLIKFSILKRVLEKEKRTSKHFSSRIVSMSIKGKRFSRVLLILAVISVFSGFAQSQIIKVAVKIDSAQTSTVTIEGQIFPENATKNWSFLTSTAGIDNLGERISGLYLKDKDENPVTYKKLIAGEFLADEPAMYFRYKVDLTVPKKPSAMAHVSWLGREQGILMLDDLLPQFGRETAAQVIFNLPEDWRIAGAKLDKGMTVIDVPNIEKAVFPVGKNWREKEFAVEKNTINLVISGEFQFTDDEAAQTAVEILKEYQNIFGAIPNEKTQIFILRFPKEVSPGNWEAETRGANVVILSSDMPFKSQSAQRLHEQFRHELFHLWMPNNLALSGNYDWFYEGFALYQSLRTGVQLNRIRFEDFLDTLARAYDLDNLQSRKISLLEASKNRWNGLNAQIYARGMLVAFLADVAVLRESKGKRSLSDVLREIYQKHQKPNAPQDGNAAILNVLEARAELRTVVERYIKGAEKLEWQTDLESFGIESGGENFPTKLTVKSNLKGRQKDLLDELGYNNWRKIIQKSK